MLLVLLLGCALEPVEHSHPAPWTMSAEATATIDGGGRRPSSSG